MLLKISILPFKEGYHFPNNNLALNRVLKKRRKPTKTKYFGIFSGKPPQRKKKYKNLEPIKRTKKAKVLLFQEKN